MQDQILNIPHKQYLAIDALSRSKIWTAYTSTWANAQYGEVKETTQMSLGTAVHAAILEPDAFEHNFICGPADRRGNKWKDAVAAAEADHKALLTEPEYTKVLRIRDSVHGNLWLSGIIQHENAQVEQTALHTDKKTGVRVKTRPDLIRPDMHLMFDLKSTRSAAQRQVENSIYEYGLHVQDAMYRDVWTEVTGLDIFSFVFIFVETAPPYLCALYDIPDSAQHEGYLVYKRMLKEYAECCRADVFPGYPRRVLRAELPTYAYKESTTID